MLPVPRPDRVVAVDRNGAMPVFWRDYLALHGSLHTFSAVTAAVARGTFMDVQRANFGIVAEAVAANYAEVLQIKPALGRWFSPADELPGAEPSAVISGRIWERYFRRDRRAIGRTSG